MSPSRRAVVTVALGLLVVLAGCSGASGGGQPAAPDSSGGGADAGSGGSAAGTADDSSDGVGSHYLGRERVVVREASMRIEVASFDPAFDRARALVRQHGGFVSDWDRNTERGWHSGRLVLRVPADNFSDVRDGLTELGSVEHEDVQARDFTREFEQSGDRLARLRGEERDLQERIAATSNESRERELREQLRSVRGTIDDLQQRRANLSRRASLSTITLRLHEPPGKKPPKNYRTAFGLGDAFLGAFYAGLRVLKYVVLLFGYLVPVALSGLLLGGFGVVCYRLWFVLHDAIDRLLPEADVPDFTEEGE